MTTRTRIFGLSLIAALMFAGTAANAQVDGRDSGPYLGIRFVGSSLHVDNQDEGFFVKDDGGGITLLGGYSFNRVFSLELDITGLRHETSDPAIDADFAAVQIFAHYRFAPGHDFRPYIKGGLAGYSLSINDGGLDVQANGGGVPLGGGFDYFFSPHFSLGADFTHNIINYEELSVAAEDIAVTFDIDEEGAMSAVGLSLCYYF